MNDHKTKWAGADPIALKDLISDSTPRQSQLISDDKPLKSINWKLLSRVEAAQDTFPITDEAETHAAYHARLTDTVDNIAELIKEDLVNDFILLQNVPTSEVARHHFLAELTTKLPPNWKIANADDKSSKSVLTIYNSNLYEIENLVLKDKDCIRTLAADKDPVSNVWFNRKKAGGQKELFLVINQYRNSSTSELVHLYNYYANNIFKSDNCNLTANSKLAACLFGGYHGILVTDPSDIYYITDSLNPLQKKTAYLPAFNRRDAGKVKDDPWTDEDIIIAWKSKSEFHDMSVCENTYQFNAATITDIRAGRALKIFSHVITEEMLLTPNNGYWQNIFNNVIQTWRRSPPTKAAVNKIRLAVPVRLKNGHVIMLGIKIDVNSDRFAALNNGGNFTNCITKITATWVNSSIEPDLVPDYKVETTNEASRKKNNLKHLIETQLNSVFNKNDIILKLRTPFLQLNKDTADDRVLTTTQGDAFLNDDDDEGKYFAVEGYKVEKSQSWSAEDRKKYIEQADVITRTLKLVGWQSYGIGAAEENTEIKGSKNPNKGLPTRPEVEIRAQAQNKFNLLTKEYYEVKKDHAIWPKSNSVAENKAIIAAEENDDGLTLTCERTTAKKALLMVLTFIKEGCDKVEIKVESEEFKKMFEEMFKDAKFPGVVTITNKKTHAPTPPPGLPPDLSRLAGIPGFGSK